MGVWEGSNFLSGISHIVCLEPDCLGLCSKLLIFGFEAEVDDLIFCALLFSASLQEGVTRTCLDKGSGDDAVLFSVSLK